MKSLILLAVLALAAPASVFAQPENADDKPTTRPGTYYAAPSGKVISRDAVTTRGEDRETTAGDLLTTPSRRLTTGTLTGDLPDAG